MNHYKKINREGSEVQYGPRTTGETYLFPNTELGIELKLLTRHPGRMPIGVMLDGVITHEAEDHFIFVENTFEKKKVNLRNPHVYMGKRINIIRKDDGTLYPTFKRPSYTENFTFQDFCHEAAEELLFVVDLLENEASVE